MNVTPTRAGMVDVRIVNPGGISGAYQCDRAAFARESEVFADIFGDLSLPPHTVYVLTGHEVDIFDHFRDYVHGKPVDLPWIDEESGIDWEVLMSSFALCEGLKADGFHESLVRWVHTQARASNVPLSTPHPARIGVICETIPRGRAFRRLLVDLWLLNPGAWAISQYPIEFAQDVMVRLRECARDTDYVQRLPLLQRVDDY